MSQSFILEIGADSRHLAAESLPNTGDVIDVPTANGEAVFVCEVKGRRWTLHRTANGPTVAVPHVVAEPIHAYDPAEPDKLKRVYRQKTAKPAKPKGKRK